MKKTIMAGLCSLAQIAVALDEMTLPVVDVYDGDSIKVVMTLPTPLNDVTVRIRGIDTPEMPASSYQTTGKLGRAGCMLEADSAIAAKKILKNLIFDGKVYRNITVSNYEWDKYGGRIVGDVSIGGIDAAAALLVSGYAVEYDGKTEKQTWCK